MEPINEALKLIAQSKDLLSEIWVEGKTGNEKLEFAQKFLQDAIDKLATV